MVRRYVPVKTEKTKPKGKGRRVLRGEGFDLYWRNTVPLPWANFVVFMGDVALSKRSYHLASNGDRLNDGLDTARLELEHPAVYEAVCDFAFDNMDRFNRPKLKIRKRRKAYKL